MQFHYLDVVPQHLAMPLGSSLAQTLPSLSSASHNVFLLLCEVVDDCNCYIKEILGINAFVCYKFTIIS